MPRKKASQANEKVVAFEGAQDFERLGVFYLGRPYDLSNKQANPGWTLYDTKDLVTHAVCVGMTGSGKTGLCVSLLEEAAIDNIPAIIIDPKGDLANLLLTFPALKGEDFLPWINEDDARKKGQSPGEYATAQAELWKKGLAAWGQDGARIQRLKEAAEAVIYTPGSNAGLPVSILRSFAAPEDDVRKDAELLRERISTTVTGLLGLIGVEADPIQSREHILLSTILHRAWTEAKDLDLAAVIHGIQSPPVAKIGVMDVEAFFPSKERFAFAMKLNNLLAAPGFQAWLDGAPLDIQQLLYTATGKPRLAIFSIAHLGDAERMFFVTLLLSQIVGWMRGQSGTTSLRALLYMDEIFGYFPPVANPPSKLPLLTLLKQARAFGLGVVLATQNPVDLDYKGLANTGTWFIGRLQTERDKARVLEGLEGASSSAGKKFDKGGMEQTLAGLGNRIFLMNNVHEDEPVVFETRWCLSYLRGPLTRSQIKTLMDPVKSQTSAVKGKSAGTGQTSGVESQSGRLTNDRVPVTAPSARPMLPPEVPQYFLPLRGMKPEGGELVYTPMLLGSAEIRFIESKSGIDANHNLSVLVPMSDGPTPLDWNHGALVELALSNLEQMPEDGAQFLPLPSIAGKGKSYEIWKRDFSAWLFQTQKIQLFRSPSTKEVSTISESERDFRVRTQQTLREQRDQEVDDLRRKYEPKKAVLDERLRKAMQAKERESGQAKQQYAQTMLSAVVAAAPVLLDQLFGTGRRKITNTDLQRAATAARGVGRAIQQTGDVGRADENVETIQKQKAELELQLQADIEAIKAKIDVTLSTIEKIDIRPNKANIAVKLFTLAWVPSWRDLKGAMSPAWR